MTKPDSEISNSVRRFGIRAVHLLEGLGLTVVLLATFVAGAIEVATMIGNRQVLLTDILLLFIYIEMVTMVKVYWVSGKLPVRMPLYIAMVALARYLIIDMKNMEQLRSLVISGSILIIALAVLVIRFGHLRYPYPQSMDAATDEIQD